MIVAKLSLLEISIKRNGSDCERAVFRFLAIFYKALTFCFFWVKPKEETMFYEGELTTIIKTVKSNEKAFVCFE